MAALTDLQVGILRQPDGSSLFRHGNTSVMVRVYGPTEVRLAKEIPDRAFVEITYKPKVKQAGCPERLLEKIVQSAVSGVILAELHPRTAIAIIIQEVQDSGSLLSCCINAVCSSLLDACVPMCSMVAAVTCALDPEGDITVNPVKKQEETAVAVVTVAFENTNSDIVALYSSGVLTQSQLQDCVAICKDASRKVFELYRDKMQNLYAKNHLTKQS